MARAFADDETASTDRALTHYRTALRLDPDNARYLCEYGLLTVRLGKTDAGLAALRRARAVACRLLDPDALASTGNDRIALGRHPAEPRRARRRL